MIKIETVVSGEIRVNCYLVYDDISKSALIVDPGQEGGKVISKIEELGLKPEMLINTHGHFDHCWADDEIRARYKIPFAAHKDEVEMLGNPDKNFSSFYGGDISVQAPEIVLNDGDITKLSFAEFKTIHTPGHTKGGICILIGNFLLTGDTLFKEDIGRTDLEGGSYEQLMQSLAKLKKLDPALIVYPGHEESTTLEYEIKFNPNL
jgi:glyoxylase-like metal-dependent hydrolase (beta-lactamase superfamily II)